MRLHIHYHFLVVVCCFFVSASYGLFYSFGVFFKSLQTEFGWSRSLTSSIHSVHLIIFAISSVLMGRLTDRYGLRLAIFTSAILLGVGFSLCSQVQTIGGLYLFYGIASLGSGIIWAPTTATAQRWFARQKGLALGLVAAGVGLGTLIYAPLSNYVIQLYGWRTAYIILGSGTALMLLFVALPVASSPEKMGLTPYGAENSEREVEKYNPLFEVDGWTINEAVRTKTFFGVTFLYFSTLFPIHLIAVHLVPYVLDIGIDRAIAASAFGLVGAFSVAGRIGIPALADRIGWRRGLILTCCGCTIMLLWLTITRKLWMLYMFVVLYGLFYGGKTPLLPGLIGSFFGNRSLAEITGTIHGLSMAFASIGPIIGGWIFDISGSYRIAFFIAAGFWLLSAVLSAVLNPPVRYATLK